MEGESPAWTLGWDYTLACALNCPTAPQAETHTSLSLRRMSEECRAFGILGFQCAHLETRVYLSWWVLLGWAPQRSSGQSQKPLCSYFSVGIHLTLISVDITNAFICFFMKKPWLYLVLGSTGGPCVKDVTAASAAPSTHSDAPKSLP